MRIVVCDEFGYVSDRRSGYFQADERWNSHDLDRLVVVLISLNTIFDIESELIMWTYIVMVFYHGQFELIDISHQHLGVLMLQCLTVIMKTALLLHRNFQH